MDCPIFISYSRKDTAIVHPLVKEIEAQTGIKCWIDLNGIESGDAFEDRIIGAIDKAEVIIFMLSDNAMKSEFAKLEVNYAKNSDKKVVPVVIDGGKLRGWFLFKFGGVDFININDAAQKQKLFSNLKSWLNVTTGTTSSNNSIIDEDKLRAELEAKIRAELKAKKEEAERKAKEEAENKVFEKSQAQQEDSAAETNSGNPDEKYYDENVKCAMRYEYGDGVPQNYEIALQQYEIAAKKKNPFAVYKIGTFYQNGYIDEVDHVTAMKKYKKAVELGYTPALVLIGQMYLNGLGTSQSSRRAFEWFTKGMEAGDPIAKCEIGLMYFYGEEPVEQDYTRALQLLTEAAEEGVPGAMVHLGYIYEHGLGVNSSIRKASKWYREASKLGNARGYANLGILYEEGRGCNLNYEKAFALYSKAAELGDYLGQYRLALIYLEGKGTEKNIKEGISNLLKSADSNYVYAINQLAICYEKGIGVDADIEKAKLLYKEAYDLGLNEAFAEINRLGGLTRAKNFVMEVDDVFYITGRGVVATGILECDVLRAGDAVVIKGGETEFDSVVIGVEMFRKILPEGQRGDNVGLILRGLNKNDVKRGMCLYFKD